MTTQNKENTYLFTYSYSVQTIDNIAKMLKYIPVANWVVGQKLGNKDQVVYNICVTSSVPIDDLTLIMNMACRKIKGFVKEIDNPESCIMWLKSNALEFREKKI